MTRSFFDIAGPDEMPKFTTRLGPSVAYSWTHETNRTIDDLWIWHWCDHSLWTWSPGVLEEHYDGQQSWWAPTGVGAHDLISVEPLHIEASVYWPSCCGMHGFIRDGQWIGV